MPRSGAPAIFMNSVYFWQLPNIQKAHFSLLKCNSPPPQGTPQSPQINKQTNKQTKDTRNHPKATPLPSPPPIPNTQEIKHDNSRENHLQKLNFPCHSHYISSVWERKEEEGSRRTTALSVGAKTQGKHYRAGGTHTGGFSRWGLCQPRQKETKGSPPFVHAFRANFRTALSRKRNWLWSATVTNICILVVAVKFCHHANVLLP